MTKKRESIEEILLKKRRHLKKANRVTHFFRRFHHFQYGLTYTLKNVDPSKKFRPELLKYFPIGAVACLEGYFRAVLRDLIDSGSPYRERTENFKDISFSLNTT